MLNRQMDFISTLPALGSDGAIELRYLSRPKLGNPSGGRIDALIRIRKNGDSKNEAKERALEVYKGIRANLVSMDEAYNWVPVPEENGYRDVFRGFKQPHVAEIARREAVVNLDRLNILPAKRPPGFVEQPVAGKAAGNSVYTSFPFTRTHTTLSRLFRVLLMQDAPVAISIALTPTRLSQSELDYLLSNMEQCERYLHLPVSGSVWDASDFIPPLRAQAAEILRLLQKSMFTFRDDCMLLKVQIASERPLSGALIEAVGAMVTEPVASTDMESDAQTESSAIAGGYDWYAPASDAEKAIATENIENISFAFWAETVAPKEATRLRYMVGAHEANCAFRFPIPVESIFPGLDTRLARTVPLPANLPEQGLVLGENLYRGLTQPVHLTRDDRRRHTYVIGQTGTGKSSLLLSMIMQDIRNGDGVGVMDPHGELVGEILGRIPDDRLADVIHINPEDTEIAVGINILECRDEVDRDSAVNHLLELFEQLYDMDDAGGPIFEQYLRNSVLLAMADPLEPATLRDVMRVFTDADFRAQRLERCRDPLVKEFWSEIALKIREDRWTLTSMAAYVTSKFSRMVYNGVIKEMVLQKRSTVDFLEVMEQGKIVLVDLCKGRLGETNSAFLGLLLSSLIQRAAFARAATSKPQALRKDFYLYVDEFQNLATESFVSLLSEARKYRLNLVLANQYFNQIPESVRNAVMGNVGTFINFRVGMQDAKSLESVYAPMVNHMDLIGLPNFNAYVKTLVHGEATRPFSIKTRLDGSERHESRVAKIRELSTAYARQKGQGVE